MLMQSYSIYIPGETYVLGTFCRNVFGKPLLGPARQSELLARMFSDSSALDSLLANSDVPSDTAIQNELAKSRSTGEMITKWYCAKSSSQLYESLRWGDKTPINTDHLPYIDAVFPEARYIWVMRHPLAVVESYVRRGLMDDYDRALDRWISANTLGLQFYRKAADRIKIVRYESFVSNPEGTLREVSDLADLEPRSPRDYPTVFESLEDIHNLPHHEASRSEVTQDRVERYKHDLPPNVVKHLWERVRPIARLFEYDAV